MSAKAIYEARKEAAGHPHTPVTIQSSNVKRLSAFVPAHSTYFAIYFTLTALHGLHVLAGALVIAYIWGPGAKMWKTDPERYMNRVEVSGLFWHFVDLVWIFLFPVLYLL
jgi:cytochrome c oxidase subunit 3